MPRANVDFLAWNRGIISKYALARTDVDRTRLSAEVMENWLPKTQGSMRIRPGTKHLGSSINDTGAVWIDFVAATDDTALLEITNELMRVWIDDALLEHNTDTGMDTTIAGFSGADTGSWVGNSSGGVVDTGEPGDEIPTMTSATTNGVTVSESSFDGSSHRGWRAADDKNSTRWEANGSLPQWLKVDFGEDKTVVQYTVRATHDASRLERTPRSWDFQGNDVDTGSEASWTTLDTGGDQTGWSVSEKRTFQVDTPQAFRFYRLRVTEVEGSFDTEVAEIEMMEAVTAQQVRFSGGRMVLDALTRGAVAETYQQVSCDTGNRGIEHTLAIEIDRGPVRFRVGSTQGNDDYIADTLLRTGNHRLAFTPETDFFLTFYSEDPVDRIVGSIAVADTGTMELPAPWAEADIENIRWRQSADVVFVACTGYQQERIERRGAGRSWSIVKYQSDNGPFLPGRTATGVKLKANATFGNTTLTASKEFFVPGHEGALFRLFTDNYSWRFPLGGEDAFTDPIRVSGITSTTNGEINDRRYQFTVSGIFSGALNVVHSTEDELDGPYTVTGRGDTGENITGTGTFTQSDRSELAINNNLVEFVKIGFMPGNYTSGTAIVSFDTGDKYGYRGGGATGIARVTSYNSPTEVDVEILQSPSTTEFTDNWNEGAWSDQQGWPSDVNLYEGRIWWHGNTYTRGSVSDDYENFDDTLDGDSRPISRVLGQGPVDSVTSSLALARMIIGTAGAISEFKSNSFDEPLTADNMTVKPISNEGAANLRGLENGTRGIVVGRSETRLYEIVYSVEIGDYTVRELTILNPEILMGGVTAIAIQRQPDTRIHCALADGSVAIFTYEPEEELLCWSKWKTEDGVVERIVALPGTTEDQVYYHVRRTINGATKRFLEKWATEAESIGDTGLSYIADCAVSFSNDTGLTPTGFDHLEGENIIVWGHDTGTGGGKDFSYDTGGPQTQKTYTVTGGTFTLPEFTKAGVGGLPFTADWKSTKLAYAAAAGTALTQMKRTDHIGFVLADAHNNALYFGRDFDNLDPLPRNIDEGAPVDKDKIFDAFDQMSMPFPGLWSSDSRICLRALAPRPVTVMAAVPNVTTQDKI